MDDSSTPNVPQLNVEAMPSQPTYFAEDGRLRFVSNRIVHKLVNLCTANGYNLTKVVNDHGKGEFTDAEVSQLMQLIGYSVSGYIGMTFVPKSTREEFKNQPLYNEHFRPLGDDE